MKRVVESLETLQRLLAVAAGLLLALAYAEYTQRETSGAALTVRLAEQAHVALRNDIAAQATAHYRADWLGRQVEIAAEVRAALDDLDILPGTFRVQQPRGERLAHLPDGPPQYAIFPTLVYGPSTAQFVSFVAGAREVEADMLRLSDEGVLQVASYLAAVLARPSSAGKFIIVVDGVPNDWTACLVYVLPISTEFAAPRPRTVPCAGHDTLRFPSPGPLIGVDPAERALQQVSERSGLPDATPSAPLQALETASSGGEAVTFQDVSLPRELLTLALPFVIVVILLRMPGELSVADGPAGEDEKTYCKQYGWRWSIVPHVAMVVALPLAAIIFTIVFAVRDLRAFVVLVVCCLLVAVLGPLVLIRASSIADAIPIPKCRTAGASTPEPAPPLP